MADEKTDAQKIMDSLDSIKKMCTDTAAKADANAARMDSMEKDREKEKADKQAEQDKADAAKADAAKADAAKAEAAAADAAKADAAKLDAQTRAGATDPAVVARLAAIEADNVSLRRQLPAALSNEDKAKFAHAQMVCDSAYQAFGDQAPGPLQAETLRDYRVRMLTKLRAHSKRYKDSDLSTIGDESIFSNIEGQIIHDSIEASTSNVVTGAPLRAATTIDKDSGHRVTRYYGDPAIAWADFMGGRARFGKIVRPAQTQQH